MSQKHFEIYFFHNSCENAIKKCSPLLILFCPTGQTWSYFGSSSRGVGGGGMIRGGRGFHRDTGEGQYQTSTQ